MGRAVAVSLLGWFVSACSPAGPGPSPSPLVPDTITLRLDAPVGQVSRFREVGNIIPLDPMDMAAPRLYETMYWTRTVTGAAGDTETVAVTLDSSIIAPPPGDHLNSPRVIRFNQTTRIVGLDSRGQVLWERPAGIRSFPAGLVDVMVGEPFAVGRRPQLRLPGRPVRPGDTWTDSIPYGGERRAGPAARRVAHLTYELKGVRVRGGARRASIAISGEVPWLPGDSALVRCGPRRVEETVDFDVDQRRPVRWSYSWTSRCDVGRILTLGGSLEGYLEH